MSEVRTLTELFREILHELVRNAPDPKEAEEHLWRESIVITAMHKAWQMGLVTGATGGQQEE